MNATVEEMRDRVGNREYHQWRAWHSYRHAMQELEMKKAGMKRGR